MTSKYACTHDIDRATYTRVLYLLGGEQVAQKLVSLLRFGTTSMSVNLPELEVAHPLPPLPSPTCPS